MCPNSQNNYNTYNYCNCCFSGLDFISIGCKKSFSMVIEKMTSLSGLLLGWLTHFLRKCVSWSVLFIWIKRSTPSIVWQVSDHFALVLLLQSQYDTSLFLDTTSASIMVQLVYVDDIVFTRTVSTLIAQFQVLFHDSFQMKDWDLLRMF